MPGALSFFSVFFFVGWVGWLFFLVCCVLFSFLGFFVCFGVVLFLCPV